MITARFRAPASTIGSILVLAVAAGACTTTAPSAASQAATPAATIAPTTSPPSATPAPTATPAPSPTQSATPTAEPTASCSAAFTGTPTVNQKVLFSGKGFTPGAYVVVTFNGPTMNNFTFDPNAKQGGVKLLKVAPDGTFGPWDVTFEPADAGDWTLGFSDGACAAQVALTIARR